jgi:hypothetical protein
VVISQTPDYQFTKNEPAVWPPAFFKEPAVKLPYDFWGQRVQGYPPYQYGRAISGSGLNLIGIVLKESQGKFSGLPFASIGCFWRSHGTAQGSHYAELDNPGKW